MRAASEQFWQSQQSSEGLGTCQRLQSFSMSLKAFEVMPSLGLLFAMRSDKSKYTNIPEIELRSLQIPH